MTLPEAERASIEAIAHGRSAKTYTGAGKGALSIQFFEIEKARVTAERYTDRLPTFAEWKALPNAARAM